MSLKSKFHRRNYSLDPTKIKKASKQMPEFFREYDFVDKNIFLTEIKKGRPKLTFNPEPFEITHKLSLDSEVNLALTPFRKFEDVRNEKDEQELKKKALMASDQILECNSQFIKN